jgi:hypothetical protein
MRKAGLPVLIISIGALAAAVAGGCSGTDGGSNFPGGPNGSQGGANPGGSITGGSNSNGSGGPCVNLQCQQVQCAGGGTTSVSGKVWDPAGVNPLYNVVVYVPNSAVAPITSGATCDQCGAVTSGDPVASALTDATGSFTLTNVPVGQNIPLVLQIGKWRRQLTIPSVASCKNTPMNDPTVMRLPRNQSEGDIPLMAIATGGADPFECLLKKVGVDTAEFTPPTATGRIRVYQATKGVQIAAGAPSATQLWGSAQTMSTYDIVLLPCEGDEYLAEKAGSYQNLVDYTSAGGRIFTTHYGYAWLAGQCSNGACGAQPFPTTGQWNVNNYDVSDPLIGTLDTSFPKGQAFQQWLGAVNALDGNGDLEIRESRHDLDKENNPPAQRWVYGTTTSGGPTVQHITFNTPIGVPDDQQCGRLVFSDFHVSAAERIGDVFPGSCKGGAMTPQEKALEFMLFDLSSCIQNDGTAPTAPPIR